MLSARAVVAVLALAAGAGAAFAVASAPSSGSFVATDPSGSHAWVANGSGNSLTIVAGGTVTFSYPSGAYSHNVDFDDHPPTACTQTAGTNSGDVPPLPHGPQPSGWEGSCRFDTPGTYAFHCDLHLSMTGTIVVEAADSTTGTSTPAPSAPAVPPTAQVTRRQTGTTVRGSVTTPAGPSRIVVTAFVSNRQLSKHRPKKAKRVKVGSQTKRSTGTAGASFAVKLNATARRALHRRHRLSVSVRIVVTPATGGAATTTATVTLRE